MNNEIIVANEERKPNGKCGRYYFVISVKNTSE
jgi:hypothetical protein